MFKSFATFISVLCVILLTMSLPALAGHAQKASPADVSLLELIDDNKDEAINTAEWIEHHLQIRSFIGHLTIDCPTPYFYPATLVFTRVLRNDLTNLPPPALQA